MGAQVQEETGERLGVCVCVRSEVRGGVGAAERESTRGSLMRLLANLFVFVNTLSTVYYENTGQMTPPK